MKITTIIIDDEKYSCENIRAELLTFSDSINIVGEAYSVASAVPLIEQLRPDLIFLDINLGDGMGFDVLEKIKHRQFKLVFVTAYDQYAIRAFKFNALDYLLKPLNKLELNRVMEKIISEQSKQSIRIDELLKNLREKKPKKIVIPSQEGYTLYEIDEIVRCQSDGNYTLIFLTNGQKILSSKTLKFFDDLLISMDFERIHNSHLVNMNHVKKYINLEGGVLKMSDESEIPISQRKKSHVLSVLEGM